MTEEEEKYKFLEDKRARLLRSIFICNCKDKNIFISEYIEDVFTEAFQAVSYIISKETRILSNSIKKNVEQNNQKKEE